MTSSYKISLEKRDRTRRAHPLKQHDWTRDIMRICIEGNIGAGKSAVLTSLSEKFNVIQEPVDQWSEWLMEFYRDKKRWAFGLQMQVLLSFAQMEQNTHAIIERSILTGRHVFTQMLYNQGYISEKEWLVYRQYYDLVEWMPDVIVYIKTDPTECAARIQQRARPGEDAIDLAYLKKIDFYYNNLIKYASGDTKVHIIDGNRPLEQVYQDVLTLINTYNAAGQFDRM